MKHNITSKPMKRFLKVILVSLALLSSFFSYGSVNQLAQGLENITKNAPKPEEYTIEDLLKTAIDRNDSNNVKKILQEKPDLVNAVMLKEVEGTREKSYTALGYAMNKHNKDIASMIIQQDNFDPNQNVHIFASGQTSISYTAFGYAIHIYQENIASMIIAQKNFNPYQNVYTYKQDAFLETYTALGYAIFHKKTAIAEDLLKNAQLDIEATVYNETNLGRKTALKYVIEELKNTEKSTDAYKALESIKAAIEQKIKDVKKQ